MKHRIVVELDTSDGKFNIDTGESLNGASDQAAAMLLTAAKKVRQAEGVLQVVVTKNLKTQVVATDFQADEILQWSELLGMLEQAKADAAFKQWFGMFCQAQNVLAQQARAQMESQMLEAQVKKGGLKF